MPVNIYGAFLSSEIYTLEYAPDNINNITLNKSTGVIPFSLPIVDNTSETSDRVNMEQMEFIHIGGVESTISLDFEIGIPDILKMTGLVTNKIAKKHKITITEWSGQISGVSFIGIVDSVRIRQDGGDPRLSCNLNFMEGANTLAGLGY